MERGGAAVVVPDGELSAARLARETAALLADPQRMRAMAAAARRLARPDAAEAVAEELLGASGGEPAGERMVGMCGCACPMRTVE